eukprot:jgi/Mesen1/8295/ME000450S07508
MDPAELGNLRAQASELHMKINDAMESTLRREFQLTKNRNSRSPTASPAAYSSRDEDDRHGHMVAYGADAAAQAGDGATEAKSLASIRDALEKLEDQLEALHLLQEQQRQAREVVLEGLEDTRRVFLQHLRSHRGLQLQVVKEALDWAGESIEDTAVDDLPLPPYTRPADVPRSPSESTSPSPVHHLQRSVYTRAHPGGVAKGLNFSGADDDEDEEELEMERDPSLQSARDRQPAGALPGRGAAGVANANGMFPAGVLGGHGKGAVLEDRAGEAAHGAGGRDAHGTHVPNGPQARHDGAGLAAAAPSNHANAHLHAQSSDLGPAGAEQGTAANLADGSKGGAETLPAQVHADSIKGRLHHGIMHGAGPHQPPPGGAEAPSGASSGGVAGGGRGLGVLGKLVGGLRQVVATALKVALVGAGAGAIGGAGWLVADRMAKRSAAKRPPPKKWRPAAATAAAPAKQGSSHKQQAAVVQRAAAPAPPPAKAAQVPQTSQKPAAAKVGGVSAGQTLTEHQVVPLGAPKGGARIGKDGFPTCSMRETVPGVGRDPSAKVPDVLSGRG